MKNSAYVEKNLKINIQNYNSGMWHSSMPSTLIIEPTNRCNLNCIMCPNHNYNERGDMPTSLFKKIISECKETTHSILLYFVGESLLHPEIVNFVQIIKTNGIPNVTISTNGSFLTIDKYIELSEAGLDELIVCVEGVTNEVHSEARAGSNLDEIETNLLLISNYRKNNISKMNIIIQMIETTHNHHQIADFIEMWDSRGFKPMVTWLDTWANQLPELEQRSRSLCPNRAMPKEPCAELWFKMIINWKGNVVLCCHDWAEKHIIGNAYNDSIYDIWNCKVINDCREHHIKHEFNEIDLCAKCKEWSTIEENIEYFIPFEKRKSWFVHM